MVIYIYSLPDVRYLHFPFAPFFDKSVLVNLLRRFHTQPADPCGDPSQPCEARACQNELGRGSRKIGRRKPRGCHLWGKYTDHLCIVIIGISIYKQIYACFAYILVHYIYIYVYIIICNTHIIKYTLIHTMRMMRMMRMMILCGYISKQFSTLEPGLWSCRTLGTNPLFKNGVRRKPMEERIILHIN